MTGYSSWLLSLLCPDTTHTYHFILLMARYSFTLLMTSDLSSGRDIQSQALLLQSDIFILNFASGIPRHYDDKYGNHSFYAPIIPHLTDEEKKTKRQD